MSRVSLVVNNHDYADYLPAAIDSCLAQDWPDVETVVVDDGSTDSSLEVIDGYRDRVSAVRQPNRGQASAFAAGLAASSGDVVLFLDADDLLLPTAAGAAARLFADNPGAVKASWPMLEVDADGRPTGATVPDRPLPRGDLRDVVAQAGADSYLSPPTSGNAWSRRFLERVLPAPVEEDFRRGADGYLITLAPLFGLVEAVEGTHSCYRVHGRNGFWSGSLERRVTGALARHEARSRTLAAVERELELPERMTEPVNSYVDWLRRMDRVLATVRAAVPAGADFLLVDDGEWGTELLADQPGTAFPERDGIWWGPPADDAAALEELHRQVGRGLRHVVVGWPAFWWLDPYPSLVAAVEPVERTDDVLVGRLRLPGEDTP